MRYNKPVTLCIAMCLLSGWAQAAPLKDVPASYWAAPAVGRVTQKKLMTPDADGKFHGERPVTRYELAVILDRFVRYMEAARKPLSQTTPVPVPMKKVMPSDSTQALAHLIGNGFLPRTTPLYVKDGTHAASAQETADAMAQVVTRLSDRALPPTPH